MYIEEYYYVDIDNICKVLFREELDLDPTDSGVVIRTDDDIAMNRAKQMIFWTKLKIDIQLSPDGDSRHFALFAFVSNHITTIHQSVNRLPKKIQKLYIKYVEDENVQNKILNKKCFSCNKLPPEGIRYKCSKCSMIYYCSKECQVEDWKYNHKDICELLSKYFQHIY